MEFRDLKQQYKQHSNLIDIAIKNVLNQADFINGWQVERLEIELAEYVGVKHCITCANGTDALLLALMTWGVGKGDAVFVPDFTFFSSGEVVPLVGAVPVFVDIEKGTYNISAYSLEKAVQYVMHETDLTPKIIVAVDLFGQPADFEQIKRIAENYGLFVLEDAAQGFGGAIDGKRACSFGDIATTSFFPAKPLGCYGDGGALFTDNDRWAELLSSYKVHGKGQNKYDNVRIGMNSRLDTLQAAVLLEKIKFFDEEIAKCNWVAENYTDMLRHHVDVPTVNVGKNSCWAQYTICFRNKEEREHVASNLKNKGIPYAVYYRIPMHLQKGFQPYKFGKLDYKVTEKVCNCCLSLPMHAYMEWSDIKQVVDCVLER